MILQMPPIGPTLNMRSRVSLLSSSLSKGCLSFIMTLQMDSRSPNSELDTLLLREREREIKRERDFYWERHTTLSEQNSGSSGFSHSPSSLVWEPWSDFELTWLYHNHRMKMTTDSSNYTVLSSFIDIYIFARVNLLTRNEHISPKHHHLHGTSSFLPKPSYNT